MSNFHRSKKWRITAARYRRYQLRAGTWTCAECAADGRYIRLEIDHVKPLNEGGAAYDFGNLQPLCATCHVRKTRKEREKPCPERQKWIDLVGF